MTTPTTKPVLFIHTLIKLYNNNNTEKRIDHTVLAPPNLSKTSGHYLIKEIPRRPAIYTEQAHLVINY